jgi:hypothetical protein
MGERGEPGLIGKDGPAGPQGERGSIGERGERGMQGERGLMGERGLQGERGERGMRGETIIGPRGERGERGDKGDAGQRGERGLEGPKGKLTKVKAWAEGVYYEGDVVVHGGGSYQANRDTAKPPGHSDWTVLAAPGFDGKDGRHGVDGKDGLSFRVRDTYDPKEKYQALDIVTLNSTWFISKKNDPGPCPGPDWKAGPVGKKGDRGDKGDRGFAGIKGEQGDVGREIIEFILDRSNYSETIVLSDGSKITRSLRPLFEQFNEDKSGAM